MRKAFVIGVLFFAVVAIGVVGYFFAVTHIDSSVILEIDPESDSEIRANILSAALDVGLRNASSDIRWFDRYLRRFYPVVTVSNDYFLEHDEGKKIITEKAFYCEVDLTSDLSIISYRNMARFANHILGRKLIKGLSLVPIYRLDTNKRILIYEKDARPVMVFHRYFYTATRDDTLLMKDFLHRLNALYTPDNERLKILGFAGDTVIEHFVKYSLKENGYAFSFKEINPILETPDVMSINLEFTVSHRGRKEPKHFTYRASEKEFKLITDSSIDFACTANNHAMDYGKYSLLDTVYYLDKYKIKHSGTGKNIEEAFKPAHLTVGDTKLSYISLCDVVNEAAGYKTMSRFKAGKNKPGVAFYDENRLKKLISEEKAAGRLVIVQFHTGYEYRFSPVKAHRKRAYDILDMGADALIGHHPHVINGVELYKDKVIAYSLGDFLFDIQKPNADEGLIVLLYLYRGRIVSWSYYPTVCHYGQVLMSDKRVHDVNKHFIALTGALNKSLDDNSE